MDKIKNEDILAAIKEIEANSLLRKGRASSTYDLIYDGKDYPPKLVVSIANKYATGIELDANEFYGGPNKPAFDLLKKEGFMIVKKSDLLNFKILNEYILKLRSGEISAAQSIKSLIETKNFERNLSVLDEIFFNNKLKEINSDNYIDTIAFIKKIHKIKSGEYNDFNVWSASKTLLRKINKNLIYRHDELNKKVGFPDNGNGLYKSFLGDNNFLTFVKNKFDKIDNKFLLFDENNLNDSQTDFSFKSFHQYTQEAGLIFAEKMVARFVASLCTKPFVICSGLSGSGKTKLAQSFVQWISESDQQYKIVPVGADWTNREPLLGYPNALKATEYISPDNGVLDLILQASNNKNLPYFLILDEMNLSHVERYFADFLSTMESKDAIPLHADNLDGVSTRLDSKGDIIPNKINLPSNLFIIGTVNIDETTYMFSPKVLDRANAIEFRITDKEIENYLDNPGILDMKKFVDQVSKKGFGASMASNFLNLAEELATSKKASTALVIFFKELKKAGAEFGYRSASEINRLVAILEILTKEDTLWDNEKVNDNDFIDIAIMQKLLPKLHGSRSKLCPILLTLAKFCILGGINDFDKKDDDFRKTYFKDFEDIASDKKELIIYPISFEKIARMHKNAIDNGFTSYAEA
jgi:5-methylcytosine-specific restriction protein B